MTYKMNIDSNDLLLKAKDIYIPVHHTVELSLMATKFMGTKYFQRLSKLKQLATCHYVYPGAVHTRFEHSVGVYHLASRLVDRIQNTSNVDQIHLYLSQVPELKPYYLVNPDKRGLTNWIAELIKIAGLLHDIGHGPYSHVFDDVFLKDSTHPMASHESRSCKILEIIVKSDKILNKYIIDSDISFMQQLIDPDKTRSGFVYQIISNTLNGLDVDKYDYLVRDSVHLGILSSFNHMRLIESVMVIDNNIVFPEQSKQDIFNMFLTRHSMHRNVYNHKAVVSAQYIITEIMQILNPIINIQESIEDMDRFVKMTDEYILQYAEIVLSNPEIFELDHTKLQDLMDRLNTHNLYPHVGTIIGDTDTEPIKDRFNEDKYVIFSNKIGYVSGNKSNPLDNIYVYRTKDRFKSIKINRSDITNLVPVDHQEQILMVFKVNLDNIDNLDKDRKDFEKISKI